VKHLVVGKIQQKATELNRRKLVQREPVRAVVEQLLELADEDRDQVAFGRGDRGARHEEVRETVHDPCVLAWADFEDPQSELKHGTLRAGRDSATASNGASSRDEIAE
jgi:hypothetical protein